MTNNISALSLERSMNEEFTVDTAHLLSKHDGGSPIVGTPDTGDSETVSHSRPIGTTASNALLLFINDIRVVVISSGNDRVSSKAKERSEGLVVVTVFHQPTRGLRGEPNATHEDESGKEGRAELQSPGDSGNVFEDDIGAEAQEDT